MIVMIIIYNLYALIYKYMYILHNIARLVGEKIGTAANAECQEYLPRATFGTRAIGSSALAYVMSTPEQNNFIWLAVLVSSTFCACSLVRRHLLAF
jgi:hypothetical protein